MIGRSVLIVGSGVAGLAAASWLLQHGFSPTIVERAPALVSYGGTVDLWGKAYDILEQMGLLEEVKLASLDVREVRQVGSRGTRRGGFDARVFGAVTAGRYASVPRSALRAILLEAVEPRVRMRFGDEPVAFEQRADGVWVGFRHGESELFGMVVGADGLHSTLREQVFGAHSRFERYLGLTVTTFEVSGYPHRTEGVHVSYGVPGRQVARLALPGDRTAFRLVVADEAAATLALDRISPQAYLREKFRGVGWELPEMLSALDGCENIHFDRVSQVHMPRWARGAVALLGDAAFAPSTLSDQGSALALIGAYVLAGELSHAVVPEGAFDRYQDVLRGLVRERQDAAAKVARAFVPSSHLGLWLRSATTRRFGIPRVARAVLRRGLMSDLTLPLYSDTVRRVSRSA